MIYSDKNPPTLDEVEDMLYWYQFTIEDIKKYCEAGNIKIAHLIARTVARHIRQEYKMHNRKDVFLSHHEDTLFLAYARAISELKRSLPLLPNKNNIVVFCDRALEAIGQVQLFIATYVKKS